MVRLAKASPGRSLQLSGLTAACGFGGNMQEDQA